ncbi:hypothetical protein MNB_SV-13-58 [hydrothermal vent metagenome]|uniref:Uncharacterized protein n=1 Tax=hydrothermal vent metagenome TaxID=652676 RepID=A0A1W1D011_9ZZZZ
MQGIVIQYNTEKGFGFIKSKEQEENIFIHALALLGASPAGLLAQKFFRHKTVKGSFQIVYWVIVLIQVGVLVYIFK